MIDLHNNLVIAIKSKDTPSIKVYRQLLSEKTNYLTSENAGLYTDLIELKHIQKLIKSHEESIEQYRNNYRNDLVKEETDELKVLQSLLPEPASKEDLTKALIEICTEQQIPADDKYKTPMIPIKKLGVIIKYICSKYPQNNSKDIADFVKVFVVK